MCTPDTVPRHRRASAARPAITLGLAASLLAGSGCTGADDSGDGESGLPPGTTTDTFPAFRDHVPSNLLVVSIETLRRDHLARYGSDRSLMPFLEGLAAEGVVLDAHRSCTNWTFPAVFCYTTGADATHAGWVPRYDTATRVPMPDLPTLAGWLSEAGFYTMLASSVDWLSSEWNTDAGYQVSKSTEAKASALWDFGLQMLDGAQDQGLDRWFLHLHFKEPHSPYNPPPEYLGGLAELDPIPYDLSTNRGHDEARVALTGLSEEERDLVLAHIHVRYEGELRWLDDQMAEAWHKLGERGFLDDALLVVWSDHGEQFWERGEVGHACALHAEENDALAFFWARNVVPGAWDGPTAHPDLAATILTLEGLDVPPEVGGLPLGTAPADRPWLGWSLGRLGPVQAVALDAFKLHYRWNTGERELYDLAVDPAEQFDLYTPEHPQVGTLWTHLRPEVEALAGLVPEYTPVEPDP